MDVVAKSQLLARLYGEWAADHQTDPENDPAFFDWVIKRIEATESASPDE